MSMKNLATDTYQKRRTPDRILSCRWFVHSFVSPGLCEDHGEYFLTLSGIPFFSARTLLCSTFYSPITSTTVNRTSEIYFLQSLANFSIASKDFSPYAGRTISL